MVFVEQVDLPEIKTLQTQEANVSTATLMTAAPYLGKACEGIFTEFMLCRQDNKPDPRPCVKQGFLVTECAIKVLQEIKVECYHEFNQYMNCVDKSSGDYSYGPCRKTQKVFDDCMKDKLCIDRPDFGYFLRPRVHKGKLAKPEPEPCPCEPAVADPTPALPECKLKEAHAPRFGGRFFWFQE